MNVNEFIKRREKLLKGLDQESAVLLYSGVTIKASSDTEHRFYVNTNFYYLTGIEQDHSAVLLVKSSIGVKQYLFIDAIDPNRTRWIGHRLEVETAKKLSGISDVLYMDALQTKLEEVLKKPALYGRINALYLDLEKTSLIGDNYQTTTQLKEQLSIAYPALKINSIYDAIVRLRMVKSTDEVAALKKAIATTHQALKKLYATLKPNLYEYQIEALFEHAIKESDNVKPSFDTIIASGKNAVILHYPNPKDKIEDGVLVLCDLGAKSDHYSADITRTYPANKRFSDVQRRVYDIVLGANKHVMSLIKPGLKLADLQSACIEYLAARCLKEGFIKTKEELGNIYYHNVSHHLGLDTHDPANKTLPLEPGNVITVEPGLYIKELGIGIRIEDNVLLTEQGCTNLSIDIPKEIKDLEAGQ